jgi:hypothetical protein
MKISKLFAVATMGLLITATAGAQSVEEMIEQAVTPLPDDLKADATVFNYDEDGVRQVLRQGSNNVECQPKNEGGFTLCYPIASSARRDLTAALSAQGLEGEALQAELRSAETSGRIQPNKIGSMIYRHYDKDDRIQLLWVVFLPDAVSDELGMSTLSQRDNSLAGQGLPWMMREGTSGAHLMIPINGTELSNAGGAAMARDTKAIKDPVEQATLPLPEDLRPYAAVIDYDEDGNRQVIRPGRNAIECQVRNETTGFTRCYHRSLGAEADMQAKLQAEGMEMADIFAKIGEARESGELTAPPFGSLGYRLYEEDDRLKLLWVMRLPYATSEELGMPTGSQRDASLAGEGRPWMMREGTSSAHLMIPINGTELSNSK